MRLRNLAALFPASSKTTSAFGRRSITHIVAATAPATARRYSAGGGWIGPAGSIDIRGSVPTGAFDYTSGRWMYNESKRLEERNLKFNASALVQAALKSVDREEDDLRCIKKSAEGGFNRIFELTMKDGLQVVARLPYPCTQPKRLTVASEVATVDMIRNHGLPVPRVYAYSADASNPVGAEYILMEKVRGRQLGDVWFSMSDKERIKILSGLADIEAKLFSIELPANGSIFYERDLSPGMGREAVKSKSTAAEICVGPNVSLNNCFEERK